MATTNQDYQSAKSAANGGPAKDVKDDIDALRSDISNLANSVSKLASDKFGTVVSDAETMAGQRLGDVESMIRKSPTQSALIAVGIGFLFGLVLTR
jgi:ElaB/YqjD/DUF883 family membrane-anchored ribosome-binding protein